MPFGPLLSIAAAFIALLLWAFASRALLRNPREDVEGGLMMLFLRTYSLWWHRLRVRGRNQIPASRQPGPLIVVANHSSGADPVLVQCPCPFEIRWLMAEDMRHPWGEWFWRWANVIFVNRLGPDRAVRPELAGIREALRHLKRGGVLGIFPEGGIERPPEHILPFHPGVGFIVARSGVPVLPAVVRGTPQIDPAWKSLQRRGHAVVEFKPAIDYRGTGMDGPAITADLRARFAEWTGWPTIPPAPLETPRPAPHAAAPIAPAAWTPVRTSQTPRATDVA